MSDSLTFSDIRSRYGSRSCLPPGVAAPTSSHFDRLHKRFERVFPPLFIAFQTVEAATTPMSGRDSVGFGWASPGLPAYMSLASLLQDAQSAALAPNLLPFRADEGNLFCLDVSRRDSVGDCPVVFWDHDEGQLLGVRHLQWPTFTEWLCDGLDRVQALRR